MALNLSYCQLIKIILSNIGGSPLAPVYTQISQGLREITQGGGIPGLAEFAQLKQFIDQVTTALNAAASNVNGAEQLAKQFFYNPVETAANTAKTEIQSRISAITTTDEVGNLIISAGKEAEYAELLSIKNSLTDFVGHTNVLSGATSPSGTYGGGAGGGFGGCTLSDLLGNGCTPLKDVPDIDLQVLIDGFKSGALLADLKNKTTLLIANTIGFTEFQTSVTNIKNTIENFNTTVTSKLNKMIIQKAVETYIVNLAVSLLSGCSNQLVNATIRPAAATALAPFVAYQQKIAAGELNADGTSPGSTTGTIG